MDKNGFKKYSLITKASTETPNISEPLIEGCVQNFHSQISPTKINVNLKPYTHLLNSSINKVIHKINQFIVAVIKQKVKLSIAQTLSLCKYFGI